MNATTLPLTHPRFRSVGPTIRRVPAIGPVLRPWSPGGEGTHAIQLVHGLAFPWTVPVEVALAVGSADLLAVELADRPDRPRAVVIGPDSDPFPPFAEVQAETAALVRALASHDVSAWMMTRGFIRPAARDALVAHRERVQVTIGLSTLDGDLQQALEPLAATPRLRLRQIVGLRRRGVPVAVEIGPLVPGVTDTKPNLATLLDALAEAGITQVTASYLDLRPETRGPMLRSLAALSYDDAVLEAFIDGPTLSRGPGVTAQLLPKARRQRGYATLTALAATRGITVRVNAWTNPDFVAHRPTASRPVPRLGRRASANWSHAG